MRYLLKTCPAIIHFLFVCLLATLSFTCSYAQPAGFVDNTYASGFTKAVGMTFDDNDRMYVWEKGGKVWIVENGVKSASPLIDISEETGDWRDFGLLGFALDPNFLTNGHIYLLYLVDRHHLMNFGTPNYNPNANEYFNATIGRITRYTAEVSTNFTTVDYNSRFVLFGESPSTGMPSLHQSHGIGSLAFGTDGTLLASLGDGASYSSVDQGSASETYYSQALADGIIRQDENVGAYRCQMLTSFSGKVLRIDPVTGDGVPSNPRYDNANPRSVSSRMWARGVRNPCRMSLRPGTGSHLASDGDPGVFYFGDVGWGGREELNVIDGPDLNFGWPKYEGMTRLTGSNNVFYSNPAYAPATHELAKVDWRGSTPRAYINGTIYNIGSTQFPGASFSGNCSIGGVWYDGTDFPTQYQNSYFHCDYGGGWIKHFGFDANNSPMFGDNFVTGASGIIFVSTSPQSGGLYYIPGANGSANSIQLISYNPGNQPPVAVINADKTFGPSSLAVNFTGDQSSDPEGSALTYSWDFGDGSSVSTLVNPNHTFSTASGAPTAFTVTLTVTDNANLTHQITQLISVNNTPPVISSTSLDNVFSYGMNSQTQLPLSAVVTDAEHSGSELSYEWQTFLHHGNHFHGEPLDTNPITSTFITPIGCDGILYYYRIVLTVTDAGGLSTTYNKEIYPDCGGPIAQNDQATGGFNQPVEIDVLANDITAGAALDPASIIVLNTPQNGTTSVDPLTGKITYTHTGGGSEDEFNYVVKDVNDNLSGVAAVRINLNYVLTIEKGILSNVASTWQTVTLSQNFNSMVVVATVVMDDQNALPAVTRIRNAAGNSFEIEVQNPSQSNLSGYTVHYIVVEEGIYNVAEHGVKMEATKVLSAVTAENNNWTLEPRSYQQAYSSPIVMGQVMTTNDLDWSVFYATGALRQDVPSSTAFTAGKHVGEDTDITRNNETLGYLVFEAGSGTLNGVPFDAVQGPNTVAGVADNANGFTYALNGVSNPSLAILGNTGENGGNGKWSVLFGSTPLSATELTLAVDEDQIGDIERNHTTEEVAYLILGKQDQTINFDTIPDKFITDVPFTVTPTASSGLPVTLSIVSGPATLSGNTITLNGTLGLVTVRASQGGNIDYTAAISVDQIFEVTEDNSSSSFTTSSQVATDSDDAEENINSAAVSLGSSDLELAFDGNREQIIGIRFPSIQVPAGATITSAYIQFTVDEVDTSPANLTISGEANSNAPTFLNVNANVSSRTKTNSNVNWSPAPWNTVGEMGVDQQTADLASIIQEIIDLPGWQFNNALSFLIDGTGERTAEAYGPASAAVAPILVINYDAVGGPPNLPPIADLTATPTSGPVALTVTFDASNSSDSDGTVVGYDWDFGDNATDNTVNPTHVYTQPGMYPVTLTVTDDDGDIDMTFATITVVDTLNIIQTSSAVTSTSDDAEENMNSGFVSTTSSDLELAYDGSRPQVVGIRFTNVGVPAGAIIASAYVQFTADETGTASSNLTVYGEDTDNSTTFVSVNNDISARTKTSASVSWSPAAWNTVGESGPAQQTANIAAIIQEIIDRPGWQFENALNILIEGTGTRTADAYGNNPATAAMLYIDFEITGGLPNVPPIAVLDATPQTGAAALSVSFDASNSSDSDGTITGYAWDLGDGTANTTINPTHIYTLPGTYTVSLIVTDDEGASDTASTLITVVDPTNLVQTSSTIAQESDDAEESINSGFVSTTSSDLELGFDGTRQQLVGIRFTGLSIPPGAIISNAYVQFMVDEPDSDPTVLNIRGQASDDALTFQPVSNDISARPQTAAAVTWSPAPWLATGDNGIDQQTPNLAAVVQEVVNRPGWTVNSSLALLIDGNGERTAEDYKPSSPEGAILYVTYEPSSSPASRIGRQIEAEFYPNPFSDVFNIRVKSKDLSWVDVKVTNVLGQTLFEGYDFNTDELITIGTNLPSGIYMVQITSGDRFEDFKIVKK